MILDKTLTAAALILCLIGVAAAVFWQTRFLLGWAPIGLSLLFIAQSRRRARKEAGSAGGGESRPSA